MPSFARRRVSATSLFDLAGYLAHRIALGGVSVSATGHDTLAARDDFFSYRRNTLKGVRDYGRGLSAIALEPDVPYLIILVFLCLLGAIATCALL